MIRSGQRFKFVALSPGGDCCHHYLLSGRYPSSQDENSNLNNVYIPKMIRREAASAIDGESFTQGQHRPQFDDDFVQLQQNDGEVLIENRF